MRRQEFAYLLFKNVSPSQLALWGKDGTKSWDDLWVEHARREANLYVDELGRLIREIFTALLKIYWEAHDSAGNAVGPRYMLVEYKLGKDGKWRPRTRRNASISEKKRRRRRRNGRTLEQFLTTIWRGLWEELGIRVTQAELIDRLVYSPTGWQPLIDQPGVEPSVAYPGLYTLNHLEFATWVLPDRHHQDFYIEWKKGKPVSVFLWWDIKSQDVYPSVEETVPLELLAA